MTEIKEKSLILKLPTKIIHTNYLSTVSSQRSYQSSSRQLTRLRMGLRKVEGCAPYNYHKGYCHGCGAQRCACFQRSPGVKLDRHAWENSTGQKTVGIPPILTTPVRIGAGPLVYPTRIGSKDIGSPRGSIGTQEVRDVQPLDSSINRIYTEHRDPAPNWSKIIGRKFSD